MKDVLKILEEDARTTPQQIAVMTGRPIEEVAAVIKQAESEGVILGYRAQVNWEKAGESQVSALIEVKVMPQRDVGFDAVAERIYRFPETHSMYLVSGQYDLAVMVAGRTMQEVSAFVSAKIAPLDGVQGTVTHFLMKRYKEGGVIVEGEPAPKRQPFSF